MKTLFAALAGLLLAGTLSAADYYTAPPTGVVGGGVNGTDNSTCLITAPCIPQRVFCAQECYAGSGPTIKPGDHVWFRGGTYTLDAQDKFSVKGWRGNHTSPVTYERYQDEKVIFECGWDNVSNSRCLATTSGAVVHTTVHLTTGSPTVTWVSGPVFFVSSSGIGKGWDQQSIAFGTDVNGSTPHTFYLVSSVASTTSLTLTSNWAGTSGDYDAIVPVKGRFIHIGRMMLINSSQQTRTAEHGRVGLTNGSPDITWADGSETFTTNPTGTVNTSGTAVTWATGPVFTCDTGANLQPCGSAWRNKPIFINGTEYTISLVLDSTHITLTTSAGTQTGVASILPSTWSGLSFTMNPRGTSSTMAVKYCLTGTSCVARTNWTGVNSGSVVTQYPAIGNQGMTSLRGYTIAGIGSKMYNMYVYDGTGGTHVSGSYGGQIKFRGNLIMYPGANAVPRSSGHGHYLQNLITLGEWGRTEVTGNLSMRAFYLAGQIYSEDGIGLNSYFLFRKNAMLANGFPPFPSLTWPATDCCSSGGGVSVGSITASKSTGCPPSEGGAVGNSLKTATGNIFDQNFYYGPSRTPFNWGGGKGSCNSTITNNKFYANATPIFLNTATFAPLTITGNTFTAPVPATGGQGGPAPLFNTTNFPSNTYLSGIPTSGADEVFYMPNADEVGKGFAVVDNKDSSATVTVDLCQMNGFVGEKYRLMNAQTGADPWDFTKGSTGTITACPENVVISATVAAADIRNPGLTVDGPGSAAWPKPPDIGPRIVPLSLERDFNAVGANTPTPTHTATATFTPSRTNTPTPSRTPSLTPTYTATVTLTNTLTPSLTHTPTGTRTPTITSTYTPSNTPTYTMTRTPTITPTPAVIAGPSFAFSQCQLTPPMVLTTGQTDYPGSYASSSIQYQGMATCPFRITTAGDYVIWIKVLSEDSNSDSYYIDIDGDGNPTCSTNNDQTCPRIFDTGSDKDPDSTNPCELTFQRGYVNWHILNDRYQIGGSCTGEGSRRLVHFTAGTHTIKLRQRDPNTRLYALFATTDQGFTPTDPPMPPGPVNQKPPKPRPIWKPTRTPNP